MTQARVPGRVIIYGTPAEEVDPPAKGIMWRGGALQGGRHPGAQPLVGRDATGSARIRRLLPQHRRGEVHLHRSSRASAHRLERPQRARGGGAVLLGGRSPALHLALEHRVQGVIPEGGIAPNVVPDHTVVDYFIRFPDEVYLEHMARMMDDAAKGAAQMTEPRSPSRATASIATA